MIYDDLPSKNDHSEGNTSLLTALRPMWDFRGSMVENFLIFMVRMSVFFGTWASAAILKTTHLAELWVFKPQIPLITFSWDHLIAVHLGRLPLNKSKHKMPGISIHVVIATITVWWQHRMYHTPLFFQHGISKHEFRKVICFPGTSQLLSICRQTFRL